MNPIIEGYPDRLVIGGQPRSIRTGFRYWMQIARMLEDESVPIWERLASLYELADLEPTGDALADLEAVTDFLVRGEKATGKAGRRTFDFDFDAGRIIASFQQQYGLDLTDPAVKLHWWHFLDLMAGLGDDTPMMQAVRIREAELPQGKTKAEKDRKAELLRAKRRLDIPPKNSTEALQRDLDIWE